MFPAAISSLERSHTDMITTIKWLPRNYQCNDKGHLRELKSLFRQFVTTSKDGSIAFWDLDWDPKEVVQRERGVQAVKIPGELQEISSPLSSLNEVFRPVFKTSLQGRPITTIAFDEGQFTYEATKKAFSGESIKKALHTIESQTQKCVRPKMIVGLLLGEIYMINFDPYDSNRGAVMRPQIAEV